MMISLLKTKAERTDPQLRHWLEQVKYSSGKKQLWAAGSPEISPLKRSLRACKNRVTQNVFATKLRFTFCDDRPAETLFSGIVADWLCSCVQLYLQRFIDDYRSAWGAGSVVVQEQLQFILQTTEVCRGAESLRAQILNRAEGFWVTGKLPEALQEQPIYRLRWLFYSWTNMKQSIKTFWLLVFQNLYSVCPTITCDIRNYLIYLNGKTKTVKIL